MIATLKGQISHIQDHSVILTVNDIGYLIHVNQTTGSQLTRGANVNFFIHTSVRENDISLYGLLREEELTLFKLLISVKGIGPKSALDMLSSSAATIQTAIAHKDEAALVLTPGIGKKTAQRIIVELESKVAALTLEENQPSSKTHLGKELEDATLALLNLGYKRHFIQSRLHAIPSEIKKAEEIIRHFLSTVK